MSKFPKWLAQILVTAPYVHNILGIIWMKSSKCVLYNYVPILNQQYHVHPFRIDLISMA